MVPRCSRAASLAALGIELGIASLGLAGCDGAPRSPAAPPDATGPSDSRSEVTAPNADGSPAFFVRRDADVTVEQPGPHDGGGRTTAYRYFDDVGNASLEFRKRALHPGAAIGPHALTHDEVYYVLAGRGELTVDDAMLMVEPQTAIFMRIGATVGLRQVGDQDLVLIIAYPPPAHVP